MKEKHTHTQDLFCKQRCEQHGFPVVYLRTHNPRLRRTDFYFKVSIIFSTLVVFVGMEDRGIQEWML